MISLGIPGKTDRGVVTTSEIDELLAAGAPVAIGVSGGKDSEAAAIATFEYLDRIGHTGPRVLVHADLGRVEWDASLPMCERLAARLGCELIVVRREAGDMMDRWLTRWANNVQRYADLSCVKVILPWSTPSMRFCTSELKVAVICRELVKRFPGQTIINASGIRRAESSGRANAPIAKPENKLTSKTKKTTGVNWHPIVEWSTPDVFRFLASRGAELHEAYTKFGMTRVSCRFCIMQSEADQVAAAAAPEAAPLYREMVDLEIASTFAFQGDRWLGDVAPHLLTEEQRAALAAAKERAAQRETIEERIPADLLYTKGWPTRMPTVDEAELLAEVRLKVAALLGIDITCTDPDSVLGRYAELMRLKADKEAA